MPPPKSSSRFALIYLLAAALLLCYAFPALAEPPPFTDISAQDAVYPYAVFLNSENILGGYPDGSFGPDRPISRAEITALLMRAAGLQGITPTEPTFSDVSPGHWAYAVIEGAVQAGIVKGFPDGTFRPDTPVTRAETTTLLLRLSSQPLPDQLPPILVSDVPTRYWAAQSIAAALDAGIFDLKSPGVFAPAESANRAEAARGLAVTLTLEPGTSRVTPIGSVSPRKGNTTVTIPGVGSRALTQESTLYENMTISTKGGSEAEIDFPDGSGLLLTENTEIIIRQALGQSVILRNGARGEMVDYLEFDLVKGRTFGALAASYVFPNDRPLPYQNGLAMGNGPLLASLVAIVDLGGGPGWTNNPSDLPWWKQLYSEQQRVQVNMPWGVAGVRGTFWSNSVEECNVSSVLDGEARVAGGGDSVAVGTGEYTSICSEGGTPSDPGPMSEEEKAAWWEVNGWVMERATEIEWFSNQVADDTEPPWLSDIVYDPVLGIEIAVGLDGQIKISPDGGVTWVPQDSGTTSDLYDITYGEGICVAVGADGTILTSTDGVTWIPQESGTSDDLLFVSYENGTFVAVGSGTGFQTSDDGFAWTEGDAETLSLQLLPDLLPETVSVIEGLADTAPSGVLGALEGPTTPGGGGGGGGDNTPTEPGPGMVGYAINNGVITVTFEKEILPGANFDGITVNGSAAAIEAKTIAGSTLLIDLSPVGPTYTVFIPAGAVTDLLGNSLNADIGFYVPASACGVVIKMSVTVTD